MRDNKQQQTVQRLTALWALAESGLGGWMHALKLPFTGIFVGGFAVMIVSLLAYYSRNNYRQMMQALALVLLVKFAVSPQSPAPAYIAVAFQGIAGAVLFRLIGSHALASLLFALTAMLESAIQKIFIMTLLFGKSLWEALDSFFRGILKDFHLPKDYSFSYWLILTYIGIYAIWGLILGIWTGGMPRRIAAQQAAIMSSYYQLKVNAAAYPLPERPKKGKGQKLFNLVLILGFIIIVFAFSDRMGKIWFVLARTIAILLLIFTIINPLTKWLIQRWMDKTRSKYKDALLPILDLQPEMKMMVKPAYQLAKERNTGLRIYSSFLLNLIVLTLQPIDDERA